MAAFTQSNSLMASVYVVLLLNLFHVWPLVECDV